MVKYSTPAELRKMSAKDLQAELRDASTSVAKLRLAVHLQKEKDTAKYVREKKQLAVLKTILTEKLQEEQNNPKVSPQSAS